MKQTEINKTISQKVKKFLRSWDYEVHCIKRAASAEDIADLSAVLAELRESPGFQDLTTRTQNRIRQLAHDELRKNLWSKHTPDPDHAERQKKIMAVCRDDAERDTQAALEDLEKSLQALSKLQRARACLHAWELAAGNMIAKRRLQEALRSCLLKKGEGDPVSLIVKPGFLVLSDRISGPWSDFTFWDADSLIQAFVHDENTGTHCIGSSCDRNGKSHAWSAPIEQKNRRKNTTWTGSPVAMRRAIKVEAKKL